MSEPVINALEFLTRGLKCCRNFVICAEEYQSLLTSTARVTVASGRFYKTFDGSTVQVLRRIRKPKRCPGCGERHIPDDEPYSEYEPPTELDGFVCIVIKGGHGFKHVNGAVPGEKYGVDMQGLALVINCDVADIGDVEAYRLRSIGLSLKHRLKETFVGYEESKEIEKREQPVTEKEKADVSVTKSSTVGQRDHRSS